MSTYELTTGADFIRGTDAADTLRIRPGTLNAGDDIDLGGGDDALLLIGDGTFDVTRPANLAGVQFIWGDESDQVLVVNQASLNGIWAIDLGGGHNVIQMAAPGRLDLHAVDLFHATIRGTAGDDVIFGSAGDDLIEGGKGNDFLVGGAGRDTAKVDAFFAQFHLVRDASTGGIHVDTPDGHDTMFQIERIELRDGIVLTDQGANGAEAWRLLRTVNGTNALESQLLDARARLDAGQSPLEVVQHLMEGLDYDRAYNTVPRSDAQFVDALYRIVLLRDADAGGRAAQLDALAHGVSRAQLLVNFADSAEHVALTGAAANKDFVFVGEIGIA